MHRLNYVLDHLDSAVSSAGLSDSSSRRQGADGPGSRSFGSSYLRPSYPTPAHSLNSSSSFGLPPPASIQSPDDVVICCAIRTPMTRANRGGLSDLFPEEMLKPLFEALLSFTRVPADRIQDICIGNVLQFGAGAISSRMSQLLAGLPDSCPIHTVNRLCSSGLQAMANIAGQIHAGYINVGVAGGVESMTHFDMINSVNPEKLSEGIFEHEGARNCLLPMGITSENVAERFGITRKQQDELAVLSHKKASAAQQSGKFDEEIIPIEIKKDGGNRIITIRKDDGIRPETTLDGLSRLKPAFKKETGTTTAGNSSQVTDGASLVLLARRSAAVGLGLPLLAKFHSFVTVGVSPDIMGIGPAVAIPKVLKQAQLTMRDIDVFEINEAFASQATYCVQELGVPLDKLNPNGGAIALGHPLGCTGSRLVATILPEMRRRHARYGIVSMCVGTGMGAAAVIENYIL